ncbi:MAG: Rv3235 family protein [Pseudonocardia sp.]
MTITSIPATPVDPGAPPIQAPRLRRLRYEPLPGERLGAAVTTLTPRDPPAPSRSGGRVADARRGADTAGPVDALRDEVETALLLVLEVLDGRRPAWQLSAHLAPEALRCVRSAARRGNGRSRLVSVRICRPTPAAAEVAAVYRLDGRARAVAARFEPGRSGSRWRCVAIRLG